MTVGYDIPADWIFTRSELMRVGSAWVGVSAQAMGVIGVEGVGGLSSPGLVGTNPERYGALVHPGDRYSYDIYSQAGEAVRACAETIVGNVAVELILGIGASQSAMRLTTYVNDIVRLAGVFDGFLLHGRMGSDGPLHDGADPYWSSVQPRAGRRVPVLSVESETDVSNGYGARQDDDETFVLWEVAGASHVDVYLAAVSRIDTGALPVTELAAA